MPRAPVDGGPGRLYKGRASMGASVR